MPLPTPPGGRRLPLQASLSLPLESIYQPEATAASDPAFLATRLRAPKLSDRRTQSFDEPVYQGLSGTDAQGHPLKMAATTAPARYKTELCRPFEENGTCRYGSKCQFAHGKAELRSVVRHPKYKTALCRTFHTTGLCPYGPRCHFIHNDDERRTAESSSEQLRQIAEAGRRQTERPRLHRQLSEYQAGSRAAALPGGVRVPGPASELQRRASSVADAVIRNHRQSQLSTVAELDPQLNLSVTTHRSLGSVADSFSPASSITDSPSPSPTAGLHPHAGEDPLSLTAAVHSPDASDRVALVAELVSQLGPHGIAALVQALQLPGAATTGTHLSPGVDGSEVDAALTQWGSPASWAIGHHYQQQQQCADRQPPTYACN